MKFLIAGDSHTQYFGITNQLRGLLPALRGIKSVNKVVSASTVAGVGKMDSTLKLGTDIRSWTESHKPDFLVLNLGQVDIELGIPFRQFVKNEPDSIYQRFNYLVDKYFEFLETVELSPDQIVLKGINLPVLCYDQDKAIKYITRIVTERFSDQPQDDSRKIQIIENLTRRYPSDLVRTDTALQFNSKLEATAKKRGYGYFDINSQLASKRLGTIDPRFVPAKFDHHIIDSLEVRSIHWKALLETARERYWEATMSPQLTD